MKNWIAFLFIFVLQSCDAPQRSRFITTPTEGVTSGFSGQDWDGESAYTGGTTTPVVSSEPGFENCNLNYLYSTNNLGSFGICKHSSLETRYKIRMNKTVTNAEKTCFIPMYIFPSGESISLNTPGPEDCKSHSSGQIYDLSLYKDYTHNDKTINGVIVIKETSLSGFISCQDSAKNFQQAYTPCHYPDQNAQAMCAQETQKHVNFVCSSFVQYNQSNYKQINF